ncbi:MAG: amino acid adenylation domain-containing protein [Cyanobacteria bacterium P01_D01_bin.105]
MQLSSSSINFRSVTELFVAQVNQAPDAIAVVGETERLTYAQFNQRVNQLANFLRQKGVGVGDLVGVQLQRSPDAIIAFLAVLQAGGAYVPIDPSYPQARRSYILRDSQAKVVLTDDAAVAQAVTSDDSIARNMTSEIVLIPEQREAIAQCEATAPDVTIGPDDIAYVIYTSGTTGNPKGVMVRHEGLVNHAVAMARAFEMTPADRMLQFSSISFDIIVEELYPTLISGAALVLRPESIATSFTDFIQFTREQKITILDLPTAFWHELVGGLARSTQLTLSECIRLVIVGGEKASRAIYAQWYSMVGDYPRWLNTYGPTETTVSATLYDPIRENFDLSRELPIGRAIENVETHVLNERLAPVDPGEPGELYIGGPGLARGYLNKPDKTAAAFVSHPSDTNQRLYKTGDIVRQLPDGNLDFVGRADFQVKIRGFRIELGEIQSCLEGYQAIEQNIVIAREDTPGDKQLVAYVVLKDKPLQDIPRTDDNASNTAEIKAFLQAHLPAYMVPSAIVVLPELPKNTNGKIDRKALPAPTQQDAHRHLVLPRTSLEKQMVAIWQSTLETDAVGITDNFFELGGNSLKVMRLFNQLESLFEQRLPLVEIFATPTIEKMAERLSKMTLTKVGALHANANSSLVPLRMGREVNKNSTHQQSNHQHKAPLFLVHDVEGDTSLYLNIARQLEVADSDTEAIRAIYAIGPKRLSEHDDAPLAHVRVSEFAQHCVEQIRRVQPAGPYLVGGLCAGGVIAFEVANQLERTGESVKLVLMDAPAPNAKPKEGLIANQRMERLSGVLASRSNVVKMVAQVWQKGLNTLSYEIANAYEEISSRVCIQAFQWLRDRDRPIPRSLQKRLSDRALILHAYDAYQLQGKSFAGDVLLIRATQGDGTKADAAYVSEYEDALFGWRDYVQQDIIVRDVPGGHSTMLSDIHAQAFVDALEPFIQ